MDQFSNNPREQSHMASRVLDLSLTAKGQGANGEIVESWELLDSLIPRGRAKTIAYYMHCATKYVQSWCREPESDGGSGQPNPIDRLCHLVEAIFIVNPLGAAYIPQFIVNHHRQLVRTHQAVGFGGSEQRRDEAAELLTAAVEAVNALNTVAATDETLGRFIELHARCDLVIQKVQDEIAERKTHGGRNR
jgi:hypothetical protein